jgi:para-nitrobenzyl esterase
VRFGQTGNPNGGGSPFWPPYDPGTDRILNFTNSGIIVGTDPLKERLDLWQSKWNAASTEESVHQ